MFLDTDKLEVYYVAAFALYRLEQLFKIKKVSTKYKAARYQILLCVRLLMDAKPLPPMNANEMAKRCVLMMDWLRDDDMVDKLFTEATTLIDKVAVAWNRDSIRTEPVTKGLFEAFGQKYKGVGG